MFLHLIYMYIVFNINLICSCININVAASSCMVAACIHSFCDVPMQDMGVDAILQCNTPVEQGGVLTRTLRGQLCYDMAALTQQLKQRYATIIICAHIQCAHVHVRVSAYTFTYIYIYIHEHVCYMNICVCKHKYMYMQFASHESVPAKSEHILW